MKYSDKDEPIKGETLYEGIKKAYMLANVAAKDVEYYQPTDNKITYLVLTERFYFGFSYLVNLTHLFKELQEKASIVEKADFWLDQPLSINDPDKLKIEINEGLRVFREYCEALVNVGIIPMPRMMSDYGYT